MVNPHFSGSPFRTRVGARAAEFPQVWAATGGRFPFSLGGSRGCTSRTVRSLIPLQHVSTDTFEPYRVDLHWPYCPCYPILTPPSASRRRMRVCACVRVGLSRRYSEDRSLLPDYMAQLPDVSFVRGTRLTFVFPTFVGLRRVAKSSAVSFGMISFLRAILQYMRS